MISVIARKRQPDFQRRVELKRVVYVRTAAELEFRSSILKRNFIRNVGRYRVNEKKTHGSTSV